MAESSFGFAIFIIGGKLPLLFISRPILGKGMVCMDKRIKKSLFGGYQKEAVQATVNSLEQQLEESRQLASQLQKEIADTRESTKELETTCRSLKNEVMSKSTEIRGLESKLEDLQRRYDDSVSAQKEYDRYLQTVGQVYMVACDSAGNIVDQANTSAKQLINSLFDSAENTRMNTETAVSSAKSVREQLANTLPSLINTLNNTFHQIDNFLTMADRVPESYANILDWQKKTLGKIDQEVTDFKHNSQSFIARLEQSDSNSQYDKKNVISDSADTHISARKPSASDTSSTAFTARYPDLTLLNDRAAFSTESLPVKPAAVDLKPAAKYSENFIYPDVEKESTVKTESVKPRLSLLEQEKMKRRQQLSSTNDDTSEIDQQEFPSYSSFEIPEDPEFQREISAEKIEQSTEHKETAAAVNSSDDPRLSIPNSYKHRPNVKELLNKYSQIKN